MPDAGMNEEEDLFKRCLSKDPTAQRELYNRYAGKMMGVCMRYANSRDEASDILQDGFVKVFQKLDSFELKGSLEGWVRRIMVNTALDQIRRNKPMMNSVDVEDSAHLVQHDDYTVETMTTETMLELLKTIPEGYRTVFNLYVIEGYSHKEIADELGISVNTSKSQFSRARDYIKKVLKQNKIA